MSRVSTQQTLNKKKLLLDDEIFIVLFTYESSYTQAILPVSKGGIGIASASHIALPAFFSFSNGRHTCFVVYPPGILC